jgi:hypothetical protein
MFLRADRVVQAISMPAQQAKGPEFKLQCCHKIYNMLYEKMYIYIYTQSIY